jgi:hypothetical protein
VSLFLPPRVAAELQQESQRHAAEVMGSLEVGATIEKWDRMLREIDPRLTMMKAKDWVKTGTSLKPGHWHLIRDNSDKAAPPSVMPISGPNGEYVHPDDCVDAIFARLRQNDLQRPGALREIREQEERIRQAHEKAREVEREERQQEILERFQAGTRTFVSMDRSTPWTQNANGRRAR